ncbi:hypothetical protein H2200_000507 [Cladophialophora chaetospira]|uniref:Uncharacterized protein n=1 Tax=Cladophialophora chaetospira TaxID=386627 RepID=A0AA38XNK6_9EURO|nr:hypothetical protein H2200_000507 [Cladophialophora chaetospira]
MNRKFAQAKKTVLVDYITPSMFTTLPKSIRYKHYPVSITAVAMLCLKVLAIFSTTLFETKLVPARPRSAIFTLQDEFNSDNYNEDFSDTRPLDTAFAILTRNLSAPLATNSRYAVQTFEATEDVPTTTGADGYLTVRFKTSSCPGVAISGDLDFVSNGQEVLALIAGVGCGDDFDPSIQALEPQASMLALALVSISDMVYPVNGVPVTANVNNVSAVLCTPTYQLQRAAVRLAQGGSDGSKSLQVDVQVHHTRNFTGVVSWTPAQALLQLMPESSYWHVFHDETSDYLELLVTDLGTKSKSAAFAMPEILSSALTRVYRAFGAQFAKQTLTRKVHDEIPGTYDVEGDRIVVNSITAWAIEATVALLIILATILLIHPWWRRIRMGIPRNLFDIATVLAASTDLKTLLELQQNLHGHEYRLSASNPPRIDATTMGVLHRPNDQSPKTQTFWLPTAFKPMFAIMTLAFPPTFFILLEVLFQFSQKNGHIVDLTAQNLNWVFVWTIVSTAILTSVATIFDTVQFSVNNLETHRYMTQRQSPAEQSIFRNFNGTSSLFTLYEGFRYRRLTVAAASALSILSPLLTIFASGLYSSKVTEISSSIRVTQTKWFNNSDAAVGFSSGLNDPDSTSITATLIQYDNLTYPRWTYDELALAQIEVSSSINATHVSTRLPAVRATVQCGVYPPAVLVNVSGPSYYWLHPPLSCGSSSTAYNKSTTRKLSGTVFTEASYFGGYYYEYGSNDFRATCGTFILGHVSAANDTSSIEALHCLFGVESLVVDANLSLPSYNLRQPPSVVPGTEEYFANLTLNPNSVLQPVNATQLYGAPDDGHNQQYQGFMTALTHGVDAVPAAELLSNRTRFVEALTHWYRVSMAQVMNDYYRSDGTRSLDAAGATLKTDRRWLVQNVVSTRLVQAVLLALWLLALMIYWTFKPRKILLAWDEDKEGSLNSLGFLGRLCTGIQIQAQDGLPDAETKTSKRGKSEEEVVALVDLPGLSDVPSILNDDKGNQGLLVGWNFGLGFYEVESPLHDKACPKTEAEYIDPVQGFQIRSPPFSNEQDGETILESSVGQNWLDAESTSIDRWDSGRDELPDTDYASEEGTPTPELRNDRALATGAVKNDALMQRGARIRKYGIYAVREKEKREEHLFLD